MRKSSFVRMCGIDEKETPVVRLESCFFERNTLNKSSNSAVTRASKVSFESPRRWRTNLCGFGLGASSAVALYLSSGDRWPMAGRLNATRVELCSWERSNLVIGIFPSCLMWALGVGGWVVCGSRSSWLAGLPPGGRGCCT